jgi:hypothetical protein
VAIDLFAAGLSAGAFILSATAYFLGKKGTRILQESEPTSPLPGSGRHPLSHLRPRKAAALLETVSRFKSIQYVPRIVAPSLFLPVQHRPSLPLASRKVRLSEDCPCDKIEPVFKSFSRRQPYEDQGLVAGFGIPISSVWASIRAFFSEPSRHDLSGTTPCFPCYFLSPP